jgi:hypothetical protein
MLKRYTYVSTPLAIYCSAYVDDTGGKACVVYVWYGMFFISARSIQNSEFAKNSFENSVYSGTITTFQCVFKLDYACVAWKTITLWCIRLLWMYAAVITKEY